MTESDTGQDSKNQSGTKNPDRNLPDFFNRQMAFNTLHLNHLQQVRCCCWCKVKNSESKSQLSKPCCTAFIRCCCWCKVKNSESKSQQLFTKDCDFTGCCCWCKVKNSESKSQPGSAWNRGVVCCCCWCKVKNSESKSQHGFNAAMSQNVVVAGVKLKILKANHNKAAGKGFTKKLLLLV